MDRIVSEGQASRRFNTVIISSFAAAAVLLSLLGIYSVIAFSAALRTQEMAIRLALGSQRANVMRLVLVSGAKLGLLGCGIGVWPRCLPHACCAPCCSRSIRSIQRFSLAAFQSSCSPLRLPSFPPGERLPSNHASAQSRVGTGRGGLC